MKIVHIGIERPILVAPDLLHDARALPKMLLDGGGRVYTYGLGESVDITPESWKAEGRLYTLEMDRVDPTRAIVSALNGDEFFVSNMPGEKADYGFGAARLPEDADMLPLLRADPEARHMALGALIFRGNVSPFGKIDIMLEHRG
ncbi:MAG TPA: hypothetical protein VF733_04970 [Candidatus Saccharimonadales bacterium]